VDKVRLERRTDQGDVPGVRGVSTAQLKEWLMWTTYVVTWLAGVVFVGTILFAAYWLVMVAAGVAWAICFLMAHATHEMHLSERVPMEDRVIRGVPGDDWEAGDE
jgi:hypothetical protein